MNTYSSIATFPLPSTCRTMQRTVFPRTLIPAIGLLIGLSINSFSQPPIITRIEVGPPTPTTPAYTIYELWPFPPRWTAHQPHGSNVCQAVTLSWTTEANKRYVVECGSLAQKLWWESPTTTLHVWRVCSPVLQGTGQVVTWHGGGAFSWSLYRIRQDP